MTYNHTDVRKDFFSAAHPQRPAGPAFVSVLSEAAQPFYAALAQHLKSGGQPGVLSDAPDGLERLLSGEAPFGALCGLLYRRHRHQLDLLAAAVPTGAQARGRAVYFSQIVVRRGHPATRLGQLRGARWAVNETASFSGYVALLAHLRRSGEDRDFLGQPSFTGSHLHSLRWLRSGLADAAAVDSSVLSLALRQDPALAAEIRVIASLGPYAAPPLVVHRSVPQETRAELLRQLAALSGHAEGRHVLALGQVRRFARVRERDYDALEVAARWAEPLWRSAHD